LVGLRVRQAVARVTLEGVRKVFADSGFVAVHDLDLDVRDGEFVVLVGPSGCGKTTTLRMIAGLESISSGRLSIGGRQVNDLPPKDRDIAMVFQSYALYPHMTVFENMAFALTLRKQPRRDIDARVERAAAILGLTSVLGRRPRQLSGGQRQRVAIGRAIVREPQVFLFDEPLSNLDAQLRLEMRREIAMLHRQLGATTIYVTHDQTEAMTLGDRIVVLDGGYVQQIGAPLALYDHPANRFVAAFIGSPPMNLIDGEIVVSAGAGDNAVGFRSRDGALRTAIRGPVAERARAWAGRQVVLGARPEHVFIAPPGSAGGEETRATLRGVEPLGYEVIARAAVGDVTVTARMVGASLPALDAPVAVHLDATHLHLFDVASGLAIDSAQGV
jgi:multiple sugar transport system ATP-binding protein